MAEIRERRTVIHNVPVERPPVVENQHDYVAYERRGISGAAVVALVIAAIAVGVLITLLVINSQQQSREDELAMERERAAAADRRAAESQSAPQQSQPQVVVVPQPQPPTVTMPMPSSAPPSSAPSASSSPSTSNVSIEVDVNSKLLDDPQLRSQLITVKFENGVATLSGGVPNEDLKARAEKLAMSVKGVRRVVNNITVKQ